MSNNNNKSGKKKKGSSSAAVAKSSKSKSPPTVVIAMGFPGSGKSYGMETIAKRSGMTLVASDEIGTDGIKKSLKKLGQSCGGICIDRVNIHPNDRKMWATEALKEDPNCRIVLVWFDTPVDVCKERVKARKNHPTLGPEMADEVIDRFAGGFKPPEEWELRGPKYALMVHVTPENSKEEMEKLIDFLKTTE